LARARALARHDVDAAAEGLAGLFGGADVKCLCSKLRAEKDIEHAQ
jgi:hypothetical protein